VRANARRAIEAAARLGPHRSSRRRRAAGQQRCASFHLESRRRVRRPLPLRPDTVHRGRDRRRYFAVKLGLLRRSAEQGSASGPRTGPATQRLRGLRSWLPHGSTSVETDRRSTAASERCSNQQQKQSYTYTHTLSISLHPPGQSTRAHLRLTTLLTQPTTLRYAQRHHAGRRRDEASPREPALALPKLSPGNA
jgi:hypothetical protein